MPTFKKKNAMNTHHFYAQRDAIFALESFQPTEQTQKIDLAVLSGRVSNAQAIDEMRLYIQQHRSLVGFVETRTWTR